MCVEPKAEECQNLCFRGNRVRQIGRIGVGLMFMMIIGRLRFRKSGAEIILTPEPRSPLQQV